MSDQTSPEQLGPTPAPAMGAPGSGWQTPPPGAYYPPGTYVAAPVYIQGPVYAVEPDAPSAGFAVLGFFFPLVGLILFLVWNDRTPLKAKSAGKGALIGVCVSAGLAVLGFIIWMILAMTLAGALAHY